MPEGRGVYVETDGGVIGRKGGQLSVDDVDRPVYGVGLAPVAGRQGADSVKGAVDDAVAVDGEQFLHDFLFVREDERVRAPAAGRS